MQDFLDADDIEEGLLLAGKRGVGQVFRRGRGAHRKRGLRVARAQRHESVADRLLEIGRKGLRLDQRPNFRTHLRQCAHVFRVERTQARIDPARQILVGQKIAEGMGRCGEAGRDLDARRQV